MRNIIDKPRLKRLAARWRLRSAIYAGYVKGEWESGDKYASRRYEGISTGFRWCAEDLEKLL